MILKYILWLHVASGLISLVAAPVAMVFRKGSPVHRAWGKIYFYGMTCIAITAVIISIVKNIPFLLMIAVFSYNMICSGYRSIYLKKLHKSQKPLLIDWLISSIALIFNTGLLIYGLFRLSSGDSFGTVATVFGSLGILYVYTNSKKFFRPPSDKNHWLFGHMSGMVGGYIATVTAFLVVNVQFLPPVVTWLTPAAIGIPALSLWRNYYKKKFAAGAEAKNILEVKKDPE